jgi:hypothetical protein
MERRSGRNFAAAEDLSIQRKTTRDIAMQQHGILNGPHLKNIMSHPLAVAIAVAIVGLLGMLVVDHGPWTHPQVQDAQIATYQTTGEAARAAGATVTPTEPKHLVEPIPPGPKPAEPPAPFTQWSSEGNVSKPQI